MKEVRIHTRLTPTANDLAQTAVLHAVVFLFLSISSVSTLRSIVHLRYAPKMMTWYHETHTHTQPNWHFSLNMFFFLLVFCNPFHDFHNFIYTLNEEKNKNVISLFYDELEPQQAQCAATKNYYNWYCLMWCGKCHYAIFISSKNDCWNSCAQHFFFLVI